MADPAVEMHCLLVGVDETVKKRVQSVLSGCALMEVPCDPERLLEPLSEKFCVILCGEPAQDGSLPELGQLLRMNYQSAPIFFVANVAKGREKGLLIKNGFTDVFFMPIDRSVFEERLAEIRAASIKGGKVFRAVRLLDVEPGTRLEFDTFLYLPANQKYIKFSNSGDELEGQRVDRLKKGSMNALFIDKADMPRFYEYTASRLKVIEGNTALSETERTDRLKGAVRELVSGMFTDSAASTVSGKKVVEDCNEVVSKYVMTTPGGSLFNKLQSLANTGSDAYDHASNVATYAALFGLALGVAKPEELAIAGLLHDLGMARIPEVVQEVPYDDLSAVDREVYQSHVQQTLDIIKERSLVVSQRILTAIACHHERFNGTGYPKGLSGSKIPIEGQILAFADYFDKATAWVPGRPRSSPLEAVQQLRKAVADDPSKMHFDPKFLASILALFPEAEKPA